MVREMKEQPKWKKVVFLIISVIALIRIAYICIGGEVDKKYFTSPTTDIDISATLFTMPCKDVVEKFSSSYDRLNSIEVVFDGIDEDRAGFITVRITSGDELIYQTDIDLDGINNLEWKKVFVNAELEQGKEYDIYLNASEDCVQVPDVLIVSDDHAAPEAISSYAGQSVIDGKIAIRYGYLQFPGRLDRAVFSSIWVIFLLLSAVFLFYFEAIIETVKKVLHYIFKVINREVFYVAAEIFGSLVIINCSGIEFQPPTRIILYLISICAALRFEGKRGYIREICNTTTKRAIMYFIYIYAAFSLVGHRIFIYPLDVRVTIAGLFVFAVTVIWCIPVVQTIICLYDKLSKVSFSQRHNVNDIIFIIVIILMLLLPAAYNLFANNPGISTNDTWLCMVQNARHLRGMLDWHPAFYCMVLRAIITVWDSTYAVIIVQYFFWTYVMMELLFYLRKKGMKDIILLCVAFFSGINAANFLQLNTIWKDIPYALSLLWTLIILAKLSLDFDEYKQKWYIYIELVTAMVGVFFYRKNGVVAFVMIALMMGIVLRKSIKMWGALAITVILIFVVKGPVYSYFEIEDPGRYGMYIGLGQDILGVYYAEGEVTEDTLQMINVMTGYNNDGYNYTPTMSNQTYSLDVEPAEFIINYLDTFIKNPVLMVRAVIAREDLMWDIFAGLYSRVGCVNLYETMDGKGNWNDYYPERIYRSLYTTMSAATAYTASSQWFSAIEWRCGLLTLLGIAAVLYVVMRKGVKKYILIVAPIIGQILSLLLSTGWSDFRYFWPLNLMNMCVVLFAIVITRDDKMEHKGE